MRIVWQEVRDLDRSSNAGRSEVAFVDTSIDGWNRLIEGIPAGIAVVLLDGTEDGLARMAEWAIGRSGYDAIHVLSHGQPGALKLGTLTLDAGMLADRSGDLAGVGSMLRPGGDLLLYACNLASGCGEDFLSALSAHIGANVAASLTPTGAADLGGDWDLNWIHGAVATNALRLDAFRGVLMAAPVLASMAGYIGENTITLTFNAPLDAASTPALTAFGSVLNPSSLEVNGTQRTITSAVISGSNIILTFSGNSLSATDVVQIRYSDLNPGADDASDILQGTGGEDVATFTEDYTVNSVRPPSVPILQSAEVNGSSLVLTYDMALDDENLPVPGDFVVEVNGLPVTVSSVAVNSFGMTVTLMLAQPVGDGDAVTVSYTDPSVSDDDDAIQSAEGADAASFSGETVTNNTPNPNGIPPTLTLTAENPSGQPTSSSVVVDLFDGVTASTVDSGQTFTGMVLTVHNVAGTGDSEALTINGIDISLNNGSSGSFGSGDYTVTLVNGVATVTLGNMALSNAAMGTLIDGISYNSGIISDFPSPSSDFGHLGLSITRPVVLRSITDSGATNNTTEINQVATVTMGNTAWTSTITAIPTSPTASFASGTPTQVEFTITNSAAFSIVPGSLRFHVDAPSGWTVSNVKLNNTDPWFAGPVAIGSYSLTFDVTATGTDASGVFPISISTWHNAPSAPGALVTSEAVMMTVVPSTPTLQSAEIDGTSLVLTYDIALNDESGPVPGDFVVEVNGTPVTVSSVVVNSVNKTVTLTLATPVEAGDSVTISYTDPSDGNDANAVQGLGGDDAESFSGEAVTNNTQDTTPPAAPVITSAATTSDTTPVIGGTAEAGATITLVIGGATYTTIATEGVWSIDLETALPVEGTLSLNTSGINIVSVTARDPAGNPSPAATQNLTIGGTVPTDPTAPTEPTNPGVPPVVETKIDGITVGTTVTTGTNGQQSQVITIPVVTPDRVEDRVDGSRADIPLVTSGTVSLLEAGLPTGVGMRVEAPSLTAQTGTNARLTLIEAIESRTSGTDQQIDRTAMTGLGNQFLDSLPTDGNLLVRIVTPTIPAGTTTAPSDPIVITGSTSSSSHEGGTGPQVALVIDVRGLPPGTVLQLQDVEFAAIIGAVTVTGGAGRQVVTGDTNAQIIVLGEDDDILFAGGGDDLVGSAGGNDLIHGEDGNDRMFGGTGNDTLDGGSGIDAVRFDGAFADFTVTRGGYGAQTVEDTRNASPEGTDTLAHAEILRFSDGVTLANPPVKVAVTEALYLAANADVRAAVANGFLDSGLAHLVQFGQAEGRLALLSVDEAFYRAENADVDRAILNGLFTSAADHFARFGASEGRDANVLFNTDWYLARNIDVADAVAAGLTTAWAHYSNFGWKEGRDPSVWFDTSEYLANHGDVATAGVNPLTHFIEYGFAENRLAPAADGGLWVV